MNQSRSRKSLLISAMLAIALVVPNVVMAKAPEAGTSAPALQNCNPSSTSSSSSAGAGQITLFETITKTCYGVWVREQRNAAQAVNDCGGWSGIGGWAAGILGAAGVGNLAFGVAVTCASAGTMMSWTLNDIDTVAQSCWANNGTGIRVAASYSSNSVLGRTVTCLKGSSTVSTKNVNAYKLASSDFVKNSTKNRYEKTASGWKAIAGSSQKGVSMGNWPAQVKANHFLSK